MPTFPLLILEGVFPRGLEGGDIPHRLCLHLRESRLLPFLFKVFQGLLFNNNMVLES